MKVRGFREVIDLISASQKPVVSHNSLNGVSLVNKFLIDFSHLNYLFSFMHFSSYRTFWSFCRLYFYSFKIHCSSTY